ncbi:MAG TPA: hypothetical protein VJP58_05530 [Candidatus Nitrosocosmicus sp.]|nr:hypothetical protein [Candidatus Nitrosocosmicus sp.]
MYYNKLTSGFVSAIFLLLVISSVNFSSIKLINAATGDLVNYNNNFQMYTSPNDPNKDSAMQNADCVVNFMTSYVYTASSAENCNNSDSSSMGSSNSNPSMSPSTPSSQNQGFAPTDGPQTGVKDGSGVGVVRVVDTNSNAGNTLPTQSSSSLATNNGNPANTNTNNNVNVNVDDDNNDNDNNAKDNNNDNDNDNNDNDNNAKVYNENTVNKQDRKLLLTTCFERAYDNGNYLSTDEIVDCASNYNS